MRTLLTLALTLLTVAAAAPAVADQTYYCVEPVAVDAPANREVATPAVCAYGPTARTP